MLRKATFHILQVAVWSWQVLAWKDLDINENGNSRHDSFCRYLQ